MIKRVKIIIKQNTAETRKENQHFRNQPSTSGNVSGLNVTGNRSVRELKIIAQNRLQFYSKVEEQSRHMRNSTMHTRCGKSITGHGFGTKSY
jgi:hypothetical protein